MTFHPRSDWTSTPAADAHPFVADLVRGTAVHWNGPPVPLSAFKDPRSYLEGVRRFHVNVRHWSDIAYNFAVDQMGNVWEGRGIGHMSGANGDTEANERWVAVLGIIGEGQEPTPAMLDGIGRCVARTRHHYPQARKIRGHKDVRPLTSSGGFSTECPGPDLYRTVLNGRLEPTRKHTQEDIVTPADIDAIATAVAKKVLAALPKPPTAAKIADKVADETANRLKD